MQAARTSASSEPELKQAPFGHIAPSFVATNSIQVHPVKRADYLLLARFLASFADETRAQDFWLKRFHWWWEINPACREEMARGWVLSDNDSIVGYLGVVPTHVQLSGETVTALNSTTWRVLPAYRNHSLRLFYQALRCARGSVLFNTTPSSEVARVLEAHRFRLVPNAGSGGKSTIIINPRRLLQLRIPAPELVKIGSWFGAPILQILQRHRLRVGQIGEGREVRCLTRADSCFDELWLRTRRSYENTNVRFAAALNWLCFGNEDFRKLLFGCFWSGRVVGYLIAGPRILDGLSVLSCLDVWLDPDVPGALADLVGYIEYWSRAEGFDLIEIRHYDRFLAQRLRSLGLFQRATNDVQHEFYKTFGLPPLDPTRSYFVSLQGDRGL